MTKTTWVANEVEDMIRNHKEMKLRDVQAVIWEKYTVKISYQSGYYDKIIVNERFHSSYSDAFRLLPEITR